MRAELTRYEVELELQRILKSDVFSSAPKLRQFLEYIVNQTLQGNEKRLKQYSIATEALGWNDTFDPNTSPAVRLDAGRLRAALDAYYSAEGAENTIKIYVPKGRYIPVFQRVPPHSNKLLSSQKHLSVERAGPTGNLEPNRLLITQLKGTSVEGGGLHFSEGMTEQLVVEFSRYPDVTISTASAEEDDKQGSTVSTEFDQYARFILRGSVDSFNTTVRVTLQLHDRKSQTVIWADRFDLEGGADDVLDRQEAIAGQVAGIIADDFGILSYRMQLELQSKIQEQWSLQNTIHFHRHMARTLTENAYRVARKNIEIGIEELPNNPMMWAAKAQTVFYGNVLGYERDTNWINLVHYCGQRSLELDRNNHYAQVAMAQYNLYNRDFDQVIDICNRFLDKNPRSASNQLSAGFFRALAGDWLGGTQLLSKALKRLHHPPGWAYKALFLNSYRLGRYNEALNFINQYYVPEHFTPPLLRSVVLYRLGRTSDAEKAADDVRRINPHLRAHAESYLRYLSPSDNLSYDFQEALRALDLL